MPLPPAAEQARAALARGDAATARRLLQPLLPRYPKDPEIAHLNGAILLELGQSDQARYFAERAIALTDAGRHHSLLGDIHMRAGRNDLARASFEKALARDPDLGLPRLRLALLAQFAGDFTGAEAHFREGLKRRPDVSEIISSFGQVLVDTGRGDEALRLIESSLAQRPTDAILRQALASLSNYVPGVTPSRSCELHRDVGLSISESLPRRTPVPRGPWPTDRPVRVALVSPDLRNHSVARFVEPLLRGTDPSRLQFYCYSCGGEDAVSERLKGLAHAWRQVSTLSTRELVDIAKTDAIDIAIDLAGNTVGHRLDAFAMGLAPLQATWLGYPHSTGLPAIDARLVDAVTDPPEADEAWPIAERRVRIDGCFLCYQPAPEALSLPITPPPSPVAFGSFNVMSKVQPNVVGVWASILHACPESVLVLKARSLGDAGVRRRYEDLFASHGIDVSRLHMRGPIDEPGGHFAAYSRVSIALDSFPYNGTTTTCEALLMGVPVVALRPGPEGGHASRVSASLLEAAQLPELIASSIPKYVELAASLAADRERLARLRSEIRPRLLGSPLCDAQSFAGRFERALRNAWEMKS